MTVHERWVGLEDVAAHLGVNKDSVYRWLGVRELRDYFRKPGNGGFWMDHVKRYSKSRRKAPIYWYLRSAKGNYGLWLY